MPGRATKRSAVAWSAHGSALIENGTTPGAGAWSLTEANRPVSLSLRGKSALALAAGFGTRRWIVPPCSRMYSSPSRSSPKATISQRRVGQLLLPGDLLAVVAQAPELAGHVVAVDVGAVQLLEALAVVDVAAGDRAGLGVRDRRSAAGSASGRASPSGRTGCRPSMTLQP